MGSSGLAAYLILAYISHTAAKITSQLVPTGLERQSRLVREWLSSGFGVSLAFATGTDLLADLGLTVLWPPAGLIATGLLMGQGLKFGLDFVGKLPGATPK